MARQRTLRTLDAEVWQLENTNPSEFFRRIADFIISQPEHDYFVAGTSAKSDAEADERNNEAVGDGDIGWWCGHPTVMRPFLLIFYQDNQGLESFRKRAFTQLKRCPRCVGVYVSVKEVQRATRGNDRILPVMHKLDVKRLLPAFSPDRPRPPSSGSAPRHRLDVKLALAEMLLCGELCMSRELVEAVERYFDLYGPPLGEQDFGAGQRLFTEHGLIGAAVLCMCERAPMLSTWALALVASLQMSTDIRLARWLCTALAVCWHERDDPDPTERLSVNVTHASFWVGLLALLRNVDPVLLRELLFMRKSLLTDILDAMRNGPTELSESCVALVQHIVHALGPRLWIAQPESISPRSVLDTLGACVDERSSHLSTSGKFQVLPLFESLLRSTTLFDEQTRRAAFACALAHLGRASRPTRRPAANDPAASGIRAFAVGGAARNPIASTAAQCCVRVALLYYNSLHSPPPEPTEWLAALSACLRQREPPSSAEARRLWSVALLSDVRRAVSPLRALLGDFSSRPLPTPSLDDGEHAALAAPASSDAAPIVHELWDCLAAAVYDNGDTQDPALLGEELGVVLDVHCWVHLLDAGDFLAEKGDGSDNVDDEVLALVRRAGATNLGHSLEPAAAPADLRQSLPKELRLAAASLRTVQSSLAEYFGKIRRRLSRDDAQGFFSPRAVEDGEWTRRGRAVCAEVLCSRAAQLVICASVPLRARGMELLRDVLGVADAQPQALSAALLEHFPGAVVSDLVAVLQRLNSLPMAVSLDTRATAAQWLKFFAQSPSRGGVSRKVRTPEARQLILDLLEWPLRRQRHAQRHSGPPHPQALDAADERVAARVLFALREIWELALFDASRENESSSAAAARGQVVQMGEKKEAPPPDASGHSELLGRLLKWGAVANSSLRVDWLRTLSKVVHLHGAGGRLCAKEARALVVQNYRAWSADDRRAFVSVFVELRPLLQELDDSMRAVELDFSEFDEAAEKPVHMEVPNGGAVRGLPAAAPGRDRKLTKVERLKLEMRRRDDAAAAASASAAASAGGAVNVASPLVTAAARPDAATKRPRTLLRTSVDQPKGVREDVLSRMKRVAEKPRVRNLDDMYAALLQWSVRDLLNEARGASAEAALAHIDRKMEHFSDAEVYSSYWEPLLMEEVRASMIKSLEEFRSDELALGGGVGALGAAHVDGSAFHSFRVLQPPETRDSLSIITVKVDTDADNRSTARKRPDGSSNGGGAVRASLRKGDLVLIRLMSRESGRSRGDGDDDDDGDDDVESLLIAAVYGQLSQTVADGVGGVRQKARNHGIILKLRLPSQLQAHAVPQSKLRVAKFTTMITHQRQYEALWAVAAIHPTLRRSILRPSSSSHGREEQRDRAPSGGSADGGAAALRSLSAPMRELLAVYCRSATLSRSQYDAVESMAAQGSTGAAAGGFSLLQGPPGTGKTTTIVALLSVLLSEHTVRDASRSTSGGNRVLVCAPSNAAVDELLVRVMSTGLDTADGESKYCPRLVRVGTGSTSTETEKVMVDALAGRGTGRSEEGSVERKLHQAQAHLQELLREYATLKRSLAELSERHNEFHAAKLERGLENFHSGRGSAWGAETGDGNAADAADAQGADGLRKLLVESQRIDAQLKQAKLRRSALQSGMDRQRDEIEALRGESAAAGMREQHGAIDNALVVFSTLNSAGHELLRTSRRAFSCVVIDEAAQAVEPEVLIPLSVASMPSSAASAAAAAKGRSAEVGAENTARAPRPPPRCVMVGDSQQLPATVLSHSPVLLQVYARSLFERLAAAMHRAGRPVAMLREQYRMHPRLREFPSAHFYGDALIDGRIVRSSSYHRAYHDDEFRRFGPLTFIDTSAAAAGGAGGGGERRTATNSLVNVSEAQTVVSLLATLTATYPAEPLRNAIAVITPYRQQSIELRRQISRSPPLRPLNIEVATVDSIQGREKRIVLLSTVRGGGGGGGGGAGGGRIGFVRDARRLNVAITRAKHALVILGDAPLLRRNSSTWAALIEYCTERRLLLRLRDSRTRALLTAAPPPERREKTSLEAEGAYRRKPPKERREVRDPHLRGARADAAPRACSAATAGDASPSSARSKAGAVKVEASSAAAVGDAAPGAARSEEGAPKSEARNVENGDVSKSAARGRGSAPRVKAPSSTVSDAPPSSAGSKRRASTEVDAPSSTPIEGDAAPSSARGIKELALAKLEAPSTTVGDAARSSARNKASVSRSGAGKTRARKVGAGSSATMVHRARCKRKAPEVEAESFTTMVGDAPPSSAESAASAARVEGSSAAVGDALPERLGKWTRRTQE